MGCRLLESYREIVGLERERRKDRGDETEVIRNNNGGRRAGSSILLTAQAKSEKTDSTCPVRVRQEIIHTGKKETERAKARRMTTAAVGRFTAFDARAYDSSRRKSFRDRQGQWPGALHLRARVVKKERIQDEGCFPC